MAARKTTKRKTAVRTKRGTGKGQKRPNKVEVMEAKRPKNGFEDLGKLAPHEVRMINVVRRATGANGSGKIKPIDRIAQLERGEGEVFANYTLGGVGKSLRQLERDTGKSFNWAESIFTPAVGQPGKRLLYVERKT